MHIFYDLLKNYVLFYQSLRNHVSSLLSFIGSAILYSLIKGLISVQGTTFTIRNTFHNHRFSDGQLVGYIQTLARSSHQHWVNIYVFILEESSLKIHGKLPLTTLKKKIVLKLFGKTGRKDSLMGCFLDPAQLLSRTSRSRLK